MPDNSSYNEKELLQHVAEGDEQAFRLLYENWHRKLGGFIMRWAGSLNLAEEIVQDVFLKIWINKEQLKGVENFDNYLFILSKNHTLNVLRGVARQRIRYKQWVIDTEAGVDTELNFPDKEIDYTQLIHEAVEQLPEQQKRVYRMKYEQRKKYETIGVEMGIAPETARKHMQAATKKITLYLKQHLSVLIIISNVF